MREESKDYDNIDALTAQKPVWYVCVAHKTVDSEAIGMIPIGVYYAFLGRTDAVDWHDCIERTAMAGADLLEASAPRLLALPRDERSKIARHLRDVGLGLTMAVALTPEADVSSDDAAVREAGTELLMSYVALAAEMGAGAIGGIVTGVGKHFPPGVEHRRAAMLANATNCLKRVADFARQNGVDMGMEVVNRYESPLVTTAEEAVQVAQTVDSPALGVHLDTYHMNIEEKSFAKAIHLAGSRLIHFHVCENDRSLPGQGHIPWAEVMTALHQTGYRGRMVIESLPGPYGTLPQRLNIWRTLTQDADVELKASIQFLRNQWEATK